MPAKRNIPCDLVSSVAKCLGKNKKVFLMVVSLLLLGKISLAADTLYFRQLTDTFTVPVSKAMYFKVINDATDPIEIMTYYKNGNKYMKEQVSSVSPIIRNGAYEEYFYDGSVKFKGNFVNNEMDGAWISYNKEKHFLETKMHYAKDIRHGKAYTFYENGKLNRLDVYVYDSLKLSTCYDTLGQEISCIQPDTLQIYSKADVMPEFPGGSTKLMAFLAANIRYPKEARDKGHEGKVVVKFYIDTDGSVKAPVIVKDGVGLGAAEETIRIIKLFPKWKPGLLDGKPVRVYYTLPITFSLYYK
jgi:TonB family protein